MRICLKNHKIAGILLVAMMFLFCFPVQAFAAGDIDLEHEVSLTVSYQDDGIPLVGAEFSIYLVAAMDGNGKLTTTEAFSGYPVDIHTEDGEAQKALATTLEGYVLRDQLSPADSAKTDEQGMASFPNEANTLTTGLYLVLGSRHTQSGIVYDAQPSMVLLPMQNSDTNDWNYDVTITTKYVSRPGSDDDALTRKALKVWKDEGHEAERPEEITVQLLQDGRVFDTVVLNAGNNWRYTWSNLDAANQWLVVEKELKGYTVEIAREETTFVITNTCEAPPPDTPSEPVKPDEPSLPYIGQLWWPVPLLVAAGLLLIVIGLLRRRYQP